METDFSPQPHEEAIQLITGKPVVSKAVFKRLLPELRGRAFVITGVESANVMRRARELIAELPRGGTWDEQKAQLVDELSPYLGDGAERRAELLLRTHGFQVFQAANWNVAQEDEDTTHLQYLATEDDRVRDSHLALNGLILPKDDPFWEKHYPPWEWGCRCRVRSMNPDLVEDARADDARRNPEDKLVLEGPALARLRNGQLVRGNRSYDLTAPSDGPEGKDAFQWQPGSLRYSFEDLRARYAEAPEVWNEFLRWAEATAILPGQTVAEWLRGGELSV